MKNTPNHRQQLPDQVRAGEAQAAREFPRDLERYLRIMVRSALQRPSDQTKLARRAHELARQGPPEERLGPDAISSGLIERVARTIAVEMTDRLQRRHAPRSPAPETVLN